MMASTDDDKPIVLESNFGETWAAMEDLVDAGLTRSIGVRCD